MTIGTHGRFRTRGRSFGITFALLEPWDRTISPFLDPEGYPMRAITTLGLVVLGLVWSTVDAGDRKNDSAGLIGMYHIVEGSRNGQKVDNDRMNEVMVRIAANAITTYTKDKKEVYAATYELDQSRKPWRITMTATITPVNGKGTKSEGLIEKNGDTVKLIYALPGGATPSEFKTGDKQQMFVLKKLEKK
jgi:uncharacterized protein (TIGR03067 family)